MSDNLIEDNWHEGPCWNKGPCELYDINIEIWLHYTASHHTVSKFTRKNLTITMFHTESPAVCQSVSQSSVMWCDVSITFTLARNLTAQTLQKDVGWFLIKSRHCALISPPVFKMRFYPLPLFLRWVSAPGNRSAILTEPAEKRSQSDTERKTQQRRAAENRPTGKRVLAMRSYVQLL